MKKLTQLILLAGLATAAPAGASETLLSRYTSNLSTTTVGSVHVIPDSATTLGAAKFLLWTHSNNPAQTAPELALFSLDSFGTVLSTQRFSNAPGFGCNAARVIATRDGGYAMLGHCTFPNPNYSPADISSVLFKVDSALNPVWSVVLDQDPAPATYFMGRDLKELSDGSLAVLSTISSPMAGQFANYNIAVTRLTAAGALIASTAHALTDSRLEGMALYESPSKELYVTGSVRSPGSLAQLLVLKLDSSGNRVWSNGYGINGVTEGAGYTIAPRTPTGAALEFYVAGYINSPVINRGRDIHLLAVDESGSLLASQVFGTPADEEVRWLSVVPKTSGALDSLYMTGYTRGVGAGAEDAIVLETLGVNTVQRFNTHGAAGGDFGRELKLDGNKLYAVGDYLRQWVPGNSARTGWMISEDVVVTQRPRCGQAQRIEPKGYDVNTNVAKIKSYPLPTLVRPIPPLSKTTGTSSPVCDKLPN
jgi:hypothetical protein